jgi:hypothetical protein
LYGKIKVDDKWNKTMWGEEKCIQNPRGTVLEAAVKKFMYLKHKHIHHNEIKARSPVMLEDVSPIKAVSWIYGNVATGTCNVCFITDLLLLLTHYVVLFTLTVFTVGGILQKLQFI